MKKIKQSLRSLAAAKLKLKKMKEEASYEKLAGGGHFPVYVIGDGEERKRYDVPVACTSSIIFQALIRQFQDTILVNKGPITLSCSKQMFESVLKLSLDEFITSEPEVLD